MFSTGGREKAFKGGKKAVWKEIHPDDLDHFGGGGVGVLTRKRRKTFFGWVLEEKY